MGSCKMGQALALLLGALLPALVGAAELQTEAGSQCSSLGSTAGSQQCPWIAGQGSGVAESTNEAESDSGSDKPATWIVRFKGYQDAEVHHKTLATAVPGEGVAWRWVKRNNAASRHPTDFGLISVSPGHHAAVAAQIAGVPGVRDMHPDRQFTGKLHWVPDKGPLRHAVLDMRGLKAAGAAGRLQELLREEGEGETEEGAPSDFSVTKRSGRFSTAFPSMEYGEEEEELHDDQQSPQPHKPAAKPTYAHDRQLLNKHSRTSMGAVEQAAPSTGHMRGIPMDSKPATASHFGPRHKSKQNSTGSGSRGRGSGGPNDQPGHPNLEQHQQQQQRVQQPGRAGHSAMRSGTVLPRQAVPEAAVDGGALHSSHRGGGGHLDMSLGSEGAGAGGASGAGGATPKAQGRSLKSRGTITSMLEADKIWKQGFSGKGIKVGGGQAVA